MERVSLNFDARRRRVILDGRPTVLQEKSWRVLSLLLARAPDVVSRKEIVETVWQGNFRTGEKGLNQAVWAIRAALSEDSTAPRFIRTVPRVGYQWVHSGIPVSTMGESITEKRIVQALTGISALAVVAVLYVTGSTSGSVAESAPSATGMVATKAYIVDRDVHVEFTNGCLGILKNASHADIGAPLLSSDGTEIALTLRESGSCRLVTIGLADGERRDFANCPTI